MQPAIIKLIAEIDEFKGLWRGIQGLPDATLHSLKRFTTIESIGSSTRIEGATLSDEEVEALLGNLEVRSFRSRDEQEVAGYATVMELIYTGWQEMELTESLIKGLHRQLMQFSEKDTWHHSEYKKFPNHVAAFDPSGRQIGIVFETTSPFDTPLKMEKLVADTQVTLAREDIHPLLGIAEFIVRFLAIHPFQDGNGRLARILTNLLLLRAGYDYVPYSSLERLIEANKERYYRALRKTQVALDEDENALDAWLIFFLNVMKKQKDVLIRILDEERKLDQVSGLSRTILDQVRKHGKATISDIVTLTDANRNTVKVHLRDLVKSSRIVQHGKGRGVFYTIA